MKEFCEDHVDDRSFLCPNDEDDGNLQCNILGHSQACQSTEINEDMMEWIVEMQSMWDQFRAPKGMQDEMLQRLFHTSKKFEYSIGCLCLNFQTMKDVSESPNNERRDVRRYTNYLQI